MEFGDTEVGKPPIIFHRISAPYKLPCYALVTCDVNKTQKTKMWLVAKMSYKSLEMNEFTDSECLPNFELEFDFLKRLRKPYRDIGYSREI